MTEGIEPLIHIKGFLGDLQNFYASLQVISEKLISQGNKGINAVIIHCTYALVAYTRMTVLSFILKELVLPKTHLIIMYQQNESHSIYLQHAQNCLVKSQLVVMFLLLRNLALNICHVLAYKLCRQMLTKYETCIFVKCNFWTIA